MVVAKLGGGWWVIHGGLGTGWAAHSHHRPAWTWGGEWRLGRDEEERVGRLGETDSVTATGQRWAHRRQSGHLPPTLHITR